MTEKYAKQNQMCYKIRKILFPFFVFVVFWGVFFVFFFLTRFNVMHIPAMTTKQFEHVYFVAVMGLKNKNKKKNPESKHLIVMKTLNIY